MDQMLIVLQRQNQIEILHEWTCQSVEGNEYNIVFGKSICFVFHHCDYCDLEPYHGNTAQLYVWTGKYTCIHSLIKYR